MLRQWNPDAEAYEEREILIDGHAGIYVPQEFAERFPDCIEDPRDRDILMAGPDHEEYWETWNDVLNTVTIEKGGKTWQLEQDQDLFLVHYEEGGTPS